MSRPERDGSLLHHRGKTRMQLLSYGTAFRFGDFYLSVRLFHGICFQENPVIPALFMLHDDKRRDIHEIVARIPGVNSSNRILVTDGEASFHVFEDAFPKLNMVLCWNYVLTDVKHWVFQHDGSSTESCCLCRPREGTSSTALQRSRRTGSSVTKRRFGNLLQRQHRR